MVMANSTWEDGNGDIFYTASSLGNCDAALYYDRLGVEGQPFPANMQKAMDESGGLETTILEMLESKLVWRRIGRSDLEAAGWKFGEYNAGRGVDYSDQVRVTATIRAANGDDTPAIRVPSHLDSILSLDFAPIDMVKRRGEQRMGEVKAFGDQYWAKFKKEGLAGFPGYQLQLSAQMIGAGERIGNRWMQALFIVGHKDGRGGVDEIVVEEVDTPPIPWGRVRSRILDIERAVDEKVVPVCPEPVKYPCPFFQFHASATEPTGGLSESEQSLLDKAAAQYELGKVKEDEGKMIKAGAAAVLLELFDRVNKAAGDSVAPLDKLRGVSYQVTEVTSNRAGGIDDDKLGVLLKTAGITKADIQKPGTVSRYPKVTKL